MTLKEFIEMYEAHDKEIDKLNAVFPLAFASDLIENTWTVFEALLEYVVKENNIDLEDTLWFIYDNELGANNFELDGIKISSLDDFLLYESGIKFLLSNGKKVAIKINEIEDDNLSFDYIPDDLTEDEVNEIASIIVRGLELFVEEYK